MGMLTKLIAAGAARKLVQRMNASSTTAPRASRWQAGAVDAPLAQSASWQERLLNHPAVTTAGNVYRRNPKLIGGLGVLAAAAVLQSLTRKRGY